VDCLAALTKPVLPASAGAEPVALLGSAVVGGLLGIALLRLVDAAAALKSAQRISDGDLDASSVGGLRTTLTVLGLLLGAATLVTFFFWLRRVVRNATRIGLVRQRYDNAWAVGGWFVPVLNLWRPKQVMNDAWAGSGGGSRSLVDWWWAAFLIGEYVVMSVSDRLLQQADPGSDLRAAYRFAAFSGLFAAVAAGLGCYLVHRLTDMQRAAMAAESG
jgi:hypothetical protein